MTDVKAPLLKNSYRFVYDKNYDDGKAVFFSPSMIYSATYALENVSQSKTLQDFSVMARTDACVTGWALDKAGNTVIGTFDAEALRTLATSTNTDTLYAVWGRGSACTLKNFTVATDLPADQGSFTLAP